MSMQINVPRAVGLVRRRLDGHPITVMEQVAVCELAVAATETVLRVRALPQKPDGYEPAYSQGYNDALDDVFDALEGKS
jgi:hypothetical protein